MMVQIDTTNKETSMTGYRKMISVTAGVIVLITPSAASSVTTECPNGTYFANGSCQPWTPEAQCPNGTQLAGGVCQPVTSPRVCRNGWQLNKHNRCVKNNRWYR